MGAFARLEARVQQVGSLLCVGLDPAGRLPERFQGRRFPLLAHNRAQIAWTHPYAAAYKANLAFYEARGAAGWRELEHTLEHLRSCHPAVYDAFTREELWGALQALWLERRPTVVLVTHDLREAVFLADRAVVMAAGPGRVVYERALLDLPRPRTIEGSFEPAFVDRTHELRSSVGAARSGGFS